ncbi:penicillin amidase [Tumebacillus sp. BK434]|uniref:penicillin acylase family protein n=1 Tax=Tumebacillus sp. BK434 TaxID=2512169 RepID=UPI0010520DB2|nr:penicillin acylase family protein [Tumebacillus sp. BK434]TCP59314.1 penicillin amidase [Tumebacillus sp. BK434]
MLKKILITSLSALLGLTLAAGGGGYWYVHDSLADLDGEAFTAVEQPVRISRDDYGVAHIYAETEHDLMFAQGYAHAQDRLWQMELSRRGVSGRLAEVFGADLVSTDRFYRTLGMHRAAKRAAEQIDAATRQNLQAYADGVNAFLQRADLPFEYDVFSIDPEPWTIEDSLGISKMMAWDLGGNMFTELFLAAAGNQVGMEKALSLIAEYAPQDARVLKETTDRAQQAADAAAVSIAPEAVAELHRAKAGLRDELGIPGESLGSNNWVVSGSKSQSGKPLLANDMHLSLQAPSVFYQNHLVAPGLYNVSGAIFPGVPGVIVGHNDKLAWGFTNVYPDVQDLYIQKPNPDNPHQFLYNGKYEEAEVIQEVIQVKDGDPVPFDNIITRQGPIITDIVEGIPVTDRLALKWSAHEFHGEISAMLAMNKAQNWQQFEQALQNFSAPAQNVVYADVDGNIAYQLAGKIPVRKKGDGLLPVPGWSDEYEWSSYVAWDDLPHAFNPEQGYLATANNKITADGADSPFITYEWAAPYRAQRIEDMIEAKDQLTLSDMQQMQLDWKNLQALQNVPVWLPALEKGTWNEAERTALQLLKTWAQDPSDLPDQAGPAIYHAMLNKTIEAVYEPQLGADLFYEYVATGLSVNAFDTLMLDAQPKWLAGSGLTKEQAIEKGFRAAVEFLQERMGDDPAKWTWGDVHQLTFRHAFGDLKPLDLLFNDGPHPYGGSHVTVNAAAYSRIDNPFQTGWGAPWRFTIDMADPAGAQDVMEMGASGQLGSDHYKDQSELWLNGTYKQMYFREQDVQAHVANEWRLLPDQP